ncbi:hypothetical protein [Sinomicrobium sp. M5D2P9]
MNKIALKKLELKTDEILERHHLKTVFGGYDGGYGGYDGACIDYCESDNDCSQALDEYCATIQFPDGCRAKRCIRRFT